MLLIAPEPTSKKVYDFDKFWQFFPVSRPTKEAVKTILFSLFPFLFRNWAVYDNWKNASTFSPEGFSLFSGTFLSGLGKNSEQIRIPVSLSPDNMHMGDSKLAIVIHAFYPDVFGEMIRLIDFNGCETGLFITTSTENHDQISGIVSELPIPSTILTVENRGRDILPFLEILPQVIRGKYDIVLKLHTKKSNHLNRREHWRHDLLNKLASKEAIEHSLAVFQKFPEIGMIGPAGHILPMHLYYGANAQTVLALANGMGIHPSKLHGLCFAAGSMFFARTAVLKPVLDLGLTVDQFETEAGQVDGTLAHSVERAFALGLIKTGTFLADTDFPENGGLLTVNRNHYFTV